jgi:folate-binding protein YgfZ
MNMAPLIAVLDEHGLLEVTGEEARAFLHAQLSNDVEHLAAGHARYAGWCSAKGRLLATLLVVPHSGGFLLQLARDLAPAVAKRLSMFVLRAKVKLADASAQWTQFGLWGEGSEAQLAALGLAVPGEDLAAAHANGAIAVRVAPQRYVLLAPAAVRAELAINATAEDWALAEIRAGRPQVVQATQDQFVPQMVNLELTGGVDFQKGCYPGQEIVARTQYRGQLKRRMVRLRAPMPLRPGQDLYSDDLAGQPSGAVVNAAGGEALAVLQIATLESGAAIRSAAGGAALEVLPLPYSQ